MNKGVAVAWLAAIAACTDSTGNVVTTPTQPTPAQVRIVGYKQHVQIGSRQHLQVDVTGMNNNALLFGFFTDEPNQTIDPIAKFVAPVDGDGNVSANSVGSVSIIARSQQYRDKTDTVRIYVDPPDASMRLHFATIAASELRSCGISAAGATFCWGSNQGSILGAPAVSRCHNPNQGDNDCNPLPALVAGAPSFAQLAVGNQHTCGLRPSGIVYCWGRNQFGEVGAGLTTPSLSPTQVPVSENVISLAATPNRTCAVTESGKLYCWGVLRGSTYVDVDSIGKCFSRNACAALPTLIDGLPPVVTVSTSRTHTCALTLDSHAYCWGLNVWGELGDGTFTSSNAPVRVATSVTFKEISAASSVTCALDYQGRAFCWGISGYPTDQCGSSNVNCAALPLELEAPVPFKHISAQDGGVCALSTDNRIYCLGESPLLGLPVGTTVTTFTQVQPSGPYAALSVGARTCAVAVDGLGYCWGNSGSGEGGTGQLRNLDRPTVIEGSLQP
jgi:alpha-tubulin suppressor-like RCC1 family protein